VLNRRLTEAPQPILYRPLDQSSGLSMALLARTRGDVPGIGQAIADEVQGLDPDLPVYAVRSMENLIVAGVAQRRFLMRLLAVFGSLATALALLGIYGVMTYVVARRTREIGIRMAIGARRADVLGMILGRSLALTTGGALTGLAVALVVVRFVRSQLFGVDASDPLTMAAVLGVMTLVATAAAYVPARRAAAVDPTVALRAE
jgi:hypothetical protein